MFAIALFGLFLALMGRDVLDAYGKVYNGTLGSKTGLGEIGVRMIPFVLAGLATALPARVGLINVGGEGQLHFGAWLATGVALYASGGPLFITIPFMVLAGFVGGSAWAGVAMLLRYWRNVNEVISTLLLNFVAILLVNVFVFWPVEEPGRIRLSIHRQLQPQCDPSGHCGHTVPLGIHIAGHCRLCPLFRVCQDTLGVQYPGHWR